MAGVEYDGSAYHGWQNQTAPPLNTIQFQCQKALSQVANCPIEITCAGRTDKGVHALMQVIHFDTAVKRRMHAWISGANHYLPKDIRLLWAKPLEDSFHARHSAIARRYHYVLYNASIRPALWHKRISWYPAPLNIQTMSIGAQFLIGEHDFSAFRGSDCEAKSTIRNVDYLRLKQIKNCILFQIQANAFLHHMVRNIVGVLIDVGKGKHQPGWVQEVLLSKQRTQASITAPPEGLYLTQVIYPEKWNILPAFESASFFEKEFNVAGSIIC